jgi:hypothetical protein
MIHLLDRFIFLEQVAFAKLALENSAYDEPVSEIGEHILPLMTMCLFTALHPNKSWIGAGILFASYIRLIT